MESEERSSITPLGVMKRKQKPASAYQYYQKLVQDFDALEREMHTHQAQQNDLEAQLERAKAKIQASKAENQREQQLQWERERDHQLEVFVQQRAAFDSLCAQMEELEAQELRLQAEVEVLHEKQQEVNDTEARRIRRLVHERTSLLENELAKGKADLDFIAHVVAGDLKQQNGNKTLISVEKIVQDVQERRRQEFKASEENFKARMQSFQREKELLAKKANELQVTKRKALEILSENQQLTIKGFFDTVKKGEDHPSLNFGEILQSLNQSGAQVEQIQTQRNSSRDFAADLEEARAILERGNQRIEAIQKNLDDRKAEAKKLGVISSEAGYDGVWGIESYSPHQYETVYFIRSLVFSWMNIAVAEVDAQPTKELLQVEINRWRVSHLNVEHDRDRERNLSLARQFLSTLIRDVTIEIAEDIRVEFESNSQHVRDAVASALKSVFFPTTGKLEPKKALVKSVDSPLNVRSSLFESSFKHMRDLRYRHNGSKPTMLLNQSLLPKQRPPATVTPQLVKSPVKKMFGLFTVSRSEVPKRIQPPSSSETVSQSVNVEIIPFIPADATSPSPGQLTITFWQNSRLRVRSIVLPSSQGHCSCLHLSCDGNLLVCGTVEGELSLWDLLPDQPTILRVWSPPKPERSRVLRVVLSPDSHLVLVFFRRKSIGVFCVNPTQSQTRAAKPDHFFPADPNKYKPRNLELLKQISATDALVELSFTTEIRERAPSAVAKHFTADWSAELSCGAFFSSFSLSGIRNGDVICGTSSGDLVKFNLQPQYIKRINAIQAAFDFPGPEDTASLNTNTIRREIFRGHRQAVIFVSCIHRESKPKEVVSVDQEGIVCIWEYNTSKFTGYGWFEPSLRVRLDLRSNLESSSSEILQVSLTPDDTRLVFMLFYADPSGKKAAGKLHFLQLLTSSMQLDRVQLSVEFTGGNGAPRFALTTNFLLLLANNVVRVYTLRTGKESREPLALSFPGQTQLVFNQITCSSNPKSSSNPATITFVVSGDQHSRILVHSFTNTIPPQSPVKNAKSKRVR
ncbi:hypothetical protein P3T76_002946 [Phytophthora citrophthora]|uniref:Uncharacterized protein n=1 Tax=Phytophthora citrophthora TaxID=4793 RepID=A0AAD9GXC1_9STRA|nr:hypothetical protein P3T76_002946 [Phytophthora citrophthora]